MKPPSTYVTRVLTPAGRDHAHKLLCDMADLLVDVHAGLCELVEDVLFCGGEYQDVEEALRQYLFFLINCFTPSTRDTVHYYWTEPQYTTEGIDAQRAQVEAHDERMLALAFMIAMNEENATREGE